MKNNAKTPDVPCNPKPRKKYTRKIPISPICNRCHLHPKTNKRSWCKACCAEVFKAWYDKNKHTNNAKCRGYRETIRLEAQAGYGGKCCWCWEDDKQSLVFDHVHNDGHIERETTNHGRSTMLYLHVIRNNFPNRYQLLCASCNTAKQVNKGVLPETRRLKYAPY